MKLRSSWRFIILLLANAILAVRLVESVAPSDLGWRPQFDQWTDIATSLVGIERTALSNKQPEMQARFWLKELAQIRGVNNDPLVAMGAAWMLLS